MATKFKYIYIYIYIYIMGEKISMDYCNFWGHLVSGMYKKPLD